MAHAPIKALLAVTCALLVNDAYAWGSKGHEIVGTLGAEAFPGEIPSFLRSSSAIATIASFATELDRSKGSGATHDRERDPGHYVDLDDAGKSQGVVPLAALPETREAYDTALRAEKQTQYRAGYLPYSIVDGFQQLVKDFAYYRADLAGERSAGNKEDREFFAKDRARRELLTLRDLGVWSHYVGDASQPLHVTLHFNGWGDFPNPNKYSTDKTVHSRFESGFVRDNIKVAEVRAAMHPYDPCGCGPADRTVRYLGRTLAHVETVYQMEARAPFAKGPADDEEVRFVTQRLADGASELRDYVVEAWRLSALASVGYPAIPVAAIERGDVKLTRASFGAE
ncbi:MAG: Nuclease [Rhodospirillales bacterium]|nr:Nuclease [Rhodospirillales bacterium]